MDTQKSALQYIKKFKNILIVMLLIIAAGGACWIGGSLHGGKAAAPPELSAVVLEQKLAEINELATVTYAYTNMAQFENSSNIYGMKVPFTTKSFILTYDGIIKAGVDLSEVKVSADGKKIQVVLPEAKILSHQIDEGSIEIFDEKNSIFNPFKIEDYNTFRKDQQKEMEKKAIGQGLLEEAQKRAKDNVSLLLTAVVPEGYQLAVQ